MTNVTFEEKIAYEIGVKLAHEAYMEKGAAFDPTIGGGGNNFDLDYYRLHDELRRKGYSRREREKLLRNDFGTQLKDLGVGAGYTLGGLATGGALAGGLAHLAGADKANALAVAHLGALAGGIGGGLLGAKRVYDLDQDAIEAAETMAEKKANWQAVKTLGSGLKGVVKGQGNTVGEAFRVGTKNVNFQGMGFRDTVGEIGKGLATPWKNMYSRFADNRQANRLYQNFKSAPQGSKARTDAYKAIRNFGGTARMNQARNMSSIAPQAGELGTMAAGVGMAGLAGTGAYMAGNAAFGGGAPQPQPQVAPHQYYLNQLSSYFGG